MAQKKTASTVTPAAVGIGVTAALAAAAGAYLLYGSKHAKQNRKTVKSWALKAKGEVLEQIEKVKQIDRAQYEDIILDVAKRYSKVKDATKGELSDLVKELKSQWGDIEKLGKAAKPAMKKAAKKAKAKKS